MTIISGAGRRWAGTALGVRWCSRARRAASAATARHSPLAPCRSGPWPRASRRPPRQKARGHGPLLQGTMPVMSQGGTLDRRTGKAPRLIRGNSPMKNDNTIRYQQLLPDVHQALLKVNPAIKAPGLDQARQSELVGQHVSDSVT